MAIKVTVGRPQSLGAVTQVTGKTTTTSSGLVTVGSSVIQTTTKSLEEIQDVFSADKANNSVLVYNAVTDRYEVKELPADSVDEAVSSLFLTGNVVVEGGTF